LQTVFAISYRLLYEKRVVKLSGNRAGGCAWRPRFPEPEGGPLVRRMYIKVSGWLQSILQLVARRSARA
jgi:hypothetical protein